MNLLHKSLIFLFIVLAVQIAGLTVSRYFLTEAEKQLEKVTYSHKVVSGRDRITHAFYESMHAAILMTLTSNESLGNRLDEIAIELPQTIKELNDSKFASPDDRRDLATISEITLYLNDEIRYLRDSISKSTTPDRFRQGLRFVNLQVAPHLDDLNAAMAALHKRHVTIERQSAALTKLHDLYNNIFNVLLVLSIVTTILTVIAFILGVTNRIKVVNENILLYAEGRPLQTPLKGRDEISILDAQFHTLSKLLSEAKAKDDAVFGNMPVGLVACLEDGTIESFNPQAEKLFGLSPTDDLKIQSLLVDGTIDSGIALPEGRLTEAVRTRWVRADGTHFPAEMSIAKFTHDGTNRALVALLDVSDREQIEQLRQEFVSIVSHDICSPLSSISTCLTLFAEDAYGTVSDRGKRRLEVAEKECARLMRLTRDLLDMARIESGNVQLDKTECSVRELIESSIDAVQLNASNKGIAIIGEPTDLYVDADADRVIQIIVNFLSNAIKYTPDGMTITVRAEEEEDAICISVIDEGPGIPEDFQKQIFERFRQVKSEDSKRGTGLGLAVCKMLAEAHGGAVGVTSEVGNGSEFWLLLPA